MPKIVHSSIRKDAFLSLRMDRELRRKITELAKSRKQTLSQFVIGVLTRELSNTNQGK